MAQLQTTFATNITGPVNFVLMRALLATAKKRCPYFVGSLPGQLEKSQGSASVKWRRVENLDPANTLLGEVNGTLAFGNTRDAVIPSITDLTVAVAKHGKAIIVNEEVDLFNVNSNSIAFMDTLGINAGEAFNGLQRDVFDAETTGRFASSAANTSSVVSSLSKADVQYVYNQLNRNSAMKFNAMGTGSTNIGTSPIRDAFWGILHVDVEEDIRAHSDFVSVEKYAGYTQTAPQEIGTSGGVRWLATETAPISTSAGVTTVTGKRGASDILNDVYSTFIFGKEAVGTIGLGENQTKEIYMAGDRVPTIEVIRHLPGSSGLADMFNEVGSIAWKGWYAGKVLNTNWVIKIESLASDLA